jgi:hypothetical protein
MPCDLTLSTDFASLTAQGGIRERPRLLGRLRSRQHEGWSFCLNARICLICSRPPFLHTYMSLMFPEMFPRSNIDNDALDTTNANLLANLSMIRMRMLIMYIDLYIQCSATIESFPMQHPYQLLQLPEVWEASCGEQCQRACAIPLQCRTRARNRYVHMVESLN